MLRAIGIAWRTNDVQCMEGLTERKCLTYEKGYLDRYRAARQEVHMHFVMVRAACAHRAIFSLVQKKGLVVQDVSNILSLISYALWHSKKSQVESGLINVKVEEKKER